MRQKTKHTLIGAALVLIPLVLMGAGAGTVFNRSRDAFAKPMANLPTVKLREFTFGNKMFNTNWVTAPASVTTLDGLGPTFNRVSCSGCHFKDGRGRPPAKQGGVMNSMLIRLSIEGKADDGGPLPHPSYGDAKIPAYEMIRHSINIHRGCFGGCTFCTISAHQGKFIASRSEKSVLKEVEQVTNMPDFKG